MADIAPLGLEPSLQAIPPGSVDPGNLYVDLQSRTIWLGVDETVDPTGAVLLSDIIAITELINNTLIDANEYTDTKLGDYLPINGSVAMTGILKMGSHKIQGLSPPTGIADAATKKYVDDTVAAGGGGGTSFQGPGWQKGMIMMWAGLASDIGINNPTTGVDLTDWHLCDGTFGTPNLVNHFIYGAGMANNKTENVGGNLVAPDTGTAHTHVLKSVKLTVAQMPPHTHALDVTSANESVSHTHPVNISALTTSDGAHAHSYQRTGSGNRWTAGTSGGSSESSNTGTDGSHSHGVVVVGNTGARSASHTHKITGNTNSRGGTGTSPTTADAHTHGMETDGEHSHTILKSNLVKAIPYFALCYIMRLSTVDPSLRKEA